MNRYYFVHGAGVPNVKHPNLKSAECEAERLARMFPGEPFTVLASVKTVVKSDVAWTEHDDDGECNGIPF